MKNEQDEPYQNISPDTDSQNLQIGNLNCDDKTTQKESEAYLEKAKGFLAEDLQAIDNLLTKGFINKNQVVALTNKSIEKAKALLTQEKSNNTTLLDDCDFFNNNKRQEVLNYLKNLKVNFDDDEITQIKSLVELVEKNAVEDYLSNLKQNDKINEENAAAKQKLRTNAQNGSAAASLTKIFTRADIGKMNCADFVKNEKLI